jgi:hypothetical protein
MPMKRWKSITAFLMITWILSCGVTEKTYRKVATDTHVTSEKKAIIAPWVSVYFPVEEGFILGEEQVRTDTVYKAYSYYDTVTNTLYSLDTVFIKRTTLRTDTVHKEDYAKLLVARRENALLSGEIVKSQIMQKQAEDKQKLVTSEKRNLIWWIIGLCVALVISIYLHFKR